MQTTRQVAKKSGAAHTKSILNVTASQAMNWMIGSGPNANSKKSLFSNVVGVVFSNGVTPTPNTEIDIRPMETMERETNDDAGEWPRSRTHAERSRKSCSNLA
jgi:hypothetical protein